MDVMDSKIGMSPESIRCKSGFSKQNEGFRFRTWKRPTGFEWDFSGQKLFVFGHPKRLNVVRRTNVVDLRHLWLCSWCRPLNLSPSATFSLIGPSVIIYVFLSVTFSHHCPFGDLFRSFPLRRPFPFIPYGDFFLSVSLQWPFPLVGGRDRAFFFDSWKMWGHSPVLRLLLKPAAQHFSCFTLFVWAPLWRFQIWNTPAGCTQGMLWEWGHFLAAAVK